MFAELALIDRADRGINKNRARNLNSHNFPYSAENAVQADPNNMLPAEQAKTQGMKTSGQDKTEMANEHVLFRENERC